MDDFFYGKVSIACFAICTALSLGVIIHNIVDDDGMRQQDVEQMIKDKLNERDQAIASGQREADSVRVDTLQKQILNIDEYLLELEGRVAELESPEEDKGTVEPEYGFPDLNTGFEIETSAYYLYTDPITGDLYRCESVDGYEQCVELFPGPSQEDDGPIFETPRIEACVQLRDNPGFETYGYTFLSANCSDAFGMYGYYIETEGYTLETPLWAEYGDQPSYAVLTPDHGLYRSPDTQHPLHYDAITASQLEVGMQICVRHENGFSRDMVVGEFVYIVTGDLSYGYLGINEPHETIDTFDEDLVPAAWPIEDMGIAPYQEGRIRDDASYWSTNWSTAGPC